MATTASGAVPPPTLQEDFCFPLLKTMICLSWTLPPPPTSFTRSNMWRILDLAITSRSIACHCSTEITNEFLGSDHSIISIQINHVQPALDYFLPRWLLSKANWSNFRLLFSDRLTGLSVSEMYTTFEDCMREAAVASIPQSKNSHKISVLGGIKNARLQ